MLSPVNICLMTYVYYTCDLSLGRKFSVRLSRIHTSSFTDKDIDQLMRHRCFLQARGQLFSADVMVMVGCISELYGHRRIESRGDFRMGIILGT